MTENIHKHIVGSYCYLKVFHHPMPPSCLKIIKFGVETEHELWMNLINLGSNPQVQNMVIDTILMLFSPHLDLVAVERFTFCTKSSLSECLCSGSPFSPSLTHLLSPITCSLGCTSLPVHQTARAPTLACCSSCIMRWQTHTSRTVLSSSF